MGKLINLNGDADKNKTLQKILEQLDTLKDELAELLSESEDTDTDSAGMDALTAVSYTHLTLPTICSV